MSFLVLCTAATISVLSMMASMPLPKDKLKEKFDPSGKWKVDSISDLGADFESDGHDFSSASVEISLTKKSAQLDLAKSNQGGQYVLTGVSQTDSTCRFECTTDTKDPYIRSFRVYCRVTEGVLIMSVITKYDKTKEDDWPSVLKSRSDRSAFDPEGEMVFRCKRVTAEQKK